MKYEIIFKNGQIKNVVSKDVNKVKNYITESFNKISSVKRLDEAVSKRIIFGFDHDDYDYIKALVPSTPKQVKVFKRWYEVNTTISPKGNLVLLSHDDEDIDVVPLPCNNIEEFKRWLATTHYKKYIQECKSEYGYFYDEYFTKYDYQAGLSAQEFVSKVLENIENAEVDGDSSWDLNIIDITNGQVLLGGVDFTFYTANEFQEMIDEDEAEGFNYDNYESATDRQNRLRATINNMSEEEQIKEVGYWGADIQFIKNPSEKVQLAAVERLSWAIRFIKNPSEKVQLMAVKNDPYSIEYIKNPSEKVQLMAVKNEPSAIKYIKNPSKKVQLAAVNKNNITKKI